MTLTNLFDELHRLDVKITEKEGRLVVDAPTGVLTDNLRSVLVTHKLDVLAHLRARKSMEQKADSKEVTSELDTLEYVLIQNQRALVESLTPFASVDAVGVDIETVGGLDPLSARTRLVQIAGVGRPVVIVDLFSMPKEELVSLQEFFARSIPKVFHNARFDLSFLSQAGFKVRGPIFDTMLAEQLLQQGLYAENDFKSGKFKFQYLVKKYLDKSLSKEQQTSDWSGSLSQEQLVYAAHDAFELLELYAVMLQELKNEMLLEVAELEFDVLSQVVEMTLTGIQIDTTKWGSLATVLEAEAKQAELILKEFLHQEKINVDSQPQVLAALKAMGIPVQSTKRDEIVHLVGQYPVIAALLKYRRLSKSLQAFIRKLPEFIHPVSGRIHPDWRQIGTDTGRFSCRKPALQQVPRDSRFRECFIPKTGYNFVIADFSQIELRVFAEIIGETRMIKALLQGLDLHVLTASIVMNKPYDAVTEEERRKAKALNFGLIFGMGAKTLKSYAFTQYEVVMSEEEAERFKRKFFDAYPAATEWHRELRDSLPDEIRTLSGRRRRWKDIPRVTELYNTPVQGSAADIVKKALVMLPIELENTGSKLVAVIHDEIILEVPDKNSEMVERVLYNTMKRAGKFYLKSVPIEVDSRISESWAKKKDQ